MNCIFCNIIRGEAHAEILYNGNHVIALLDINPIHYGHALIVPKVHCNDFLSVPKEALPELMVAAQTVAGAIVTSLKPHGFNIFSNNGEAAGQSVFHFHLHITPRYDDDNIQFLLKLKKYPEGEMKSYADSLRQYINSHSS